MDACTRVGRLVNPKREGNNRRKRPMQLQLLAANSGQGKEESLKEEKNLVSPGRASP